MGVWTVAAPMAVALARAVLAAAVLVLVDDVVVDAVWLVVVVTAVVVTAAVGFTVGEEAVGGTVGLWVRTGLFVDRISG